MSVSNTVAELIAVNLSYLPPELLRVLRIISCFGIQACVSLLEILEDFQGGLIAAVNPFVQQGILDKAGPLVIFAHDLIQQEIYEGIPSGERSNLHLEIGQFLRKQLELATTIGMEQLSLDDRTFYAGRRSITSSLLSLACDQINSSGPQNFSDYNQRRDFAELNLASGQKCARESNFRAALYYFSKGIYLLHNDCGNNSVDQPQQSCWLTCARLCRALRQGAVNASFALGESDGVYRYAKEVVANSTFEDTLEVQQVVLRSLSQSGRHEECISIGTNILRRLNFDFAESPPKSSILIAMKSTDVIIAQCSLDRMMSLCEKHIDDSSQNVVKFLDAFFVSCYSGGSLAWPLIACAIVKYSLTHGICSEAATAFASFGVLNIFLKGDFASGQYMAKVARAITTKHQTMNKSKIPHVENRADILLYHTIDVWWTSPRDISRHLLKYHDDAMKCGQLDVAIFSLRQSWRFKLLGGENLSLIFQSAEDRLKLIAKFSQHSAKHGILDNILLGALTGKFWDSFSVFEGSINNISDLQAEAVSLKDNQLLFTVHLYKMMIRLWRGDYEAAEESSRTASNVNPTDKMPSIYLICHTFFGGIIRFQLYRKIGDEQRLKNGKEMMEEMETWSKNCVAVFENKLFLMQAEYFASIDGHNDAERLYIKSINASRDHGNIHELGLAYELLGKFYSARGSSSYSIHCFKHAHKFYTQWGADAVAEKILREIPGLDITTLDIDVEIGNTSKISREWDS